MDMGAMDTMAGTSNKLRIGIKNADRLEAFTVATPSDLIIFNSRFCFKAVS